MPRKGARGARLRPQVDGPFRRKAPTAADADREVDSRLTGDDLYIGWPATRPPVDVRADTSTQR